MYQKNKFRQCFDCIHRYNKETPCLCDSCEQRNPTNFTEVEQDGDV